MDSYGKRIKLLRDAAGMSQAALGKQIGTTGVTIMRYEKGQREPRIDQLKKIADVFDVSISFLQSAAPFEDLAFLESFKSVILFNLEQRGFFDSKGRAVSEIGDQEYWQNVSKYIVSVVHAGKNLLNIQYTEGSEDKAKFVSAHFNLDFDSAISQLPDSEHTIAAYQCITGIARLNPDGLQKLLERLEELLFMDKYTV